VHWHERLQALLHVGPHSSQGLLRHGGPVNDPTAYSSLVGALQYLTFTRLDITYAVQQVCLHMHNPVSPISQQQSASSDTSRGPSTMTCFFNVPLRRTSSSILMLTRPVVPTLTNPLRAMWCF
jgi:hypothetical protein